MFSKNPENFIDKTFSQVFSQMRPIWMSSILKSSPSSHWLAFISAESLSSIPPFHLFAPLY